MSAPAVAVFGNGEKFAVAWKDVSAGEPNVFWAISDTPEFVDGQLVHSETRGRQDHPSLCFDSSGTAWVAWEDNRNEKQEIWVRSSGSDVAQRLNIKDSGSLSFPSIAAGKNLIGIAFESQDANKKSIQFCLVTPMR